MCLSKVDRVYDPPSPKSGFGYKVVERNFGFAARLFRWKYKADIQNVSFHRNKWNRDRKKGNIVAVDAITYRKGFHIFKTLSSAMEWRSPLEIIVKVEYCDIVAEGKQMVCCCRKNSWRKVVVARKFRIIKEVA